VVEDRPAQAYESPVVQQEKSPASDLSAKLNNIFGLQTVSGYGVSVTSYGLPIIGIGLGTLLFGLMVYALVAFITNDTIVSNTTGQMVGNSVSIEEFIALVNDSRFWFGYCLLALPMAIYVFAFWTYIHILYDSRLAEIFKEIGKDSKLMEKLEDRYWAEIDEDLFRLQNDFLKYYPSQSAFYGVSFWFKITVNIRKKFLLIKAQRTKSKFMTNMVRKLSIGLDGSTLSGFFSALILLEVIVAASFVLPAIEFSKIGQIGANLVQVQGSLGDLNDTRRYISFWAIEWAVFGAFVYSFVSLMERVPRKDITPRYYLIIAIRFIFAIALSSLFFLAFQGGNLIEDAAGTNGDGTFASVAAISFTIGMFPNIFFRKLWSIVGTKIGRSFSRDIPLENMTGISASEATRFWEEGVSNVDQLADSSVEDLFRKTRYDVRHLQGLVGRALFWKYVIGIEQIIRILESQEEARKTELSKKIFRFADIQSLCSYLFDKQLEKVLEVDIAELLKNNERFAEWEKQLEIPAEILRQVVSRALYFQERLSFKFMEQGMVNVLKEELQMDEQNVIAVVNKK
jgi:hypothetical protein